VVGWALLRRCHGRCRMVPMTSAVVMASASSGSDHSSNHVIASVIVLKQAYQGSNENSGKFIHFTLSLCLCSWPFTLCFEQVTDNVL
jgi:hypothetical protein